jgi:hypothetical protein
MMIAIITVFLTVGAILTVNRAGESKNICNYNYVEDSKK